MEVLAIRKVSPKARCSHLVHDTWRNPCSLNECVNMEHFIIIGDNYLEVRFGEMIWGTTILSLYISMKTGQMWGLLKAQVIAGSFILIMFP